MRLLRYSDEQLVMREYGHLAVLLVPPDAVQPEGQPLRQREVHRLVEVQLPRMRQQKVSCRDKIYQQTP